MKKLNMTSNTKNVKYLYTKCPVCGIRVHSSKLNKHIMSLHKEYYDLYIGRKDGRVNPNEGTSTDCGIREPESISGQQAFEET